jgi:hypothetical protein
LSAYADIENAGLAVGTGLARRKRLGGPCGWNQGPFGGKIFEIPVGRAEDLQGGLAGVIRLHAIIDRYLKERP